MERKPFSVFALKRLEIKCFMDLLQKYFFLFKKKTENFRIYVLEKMTIKFES